MLKYLNTQVTFAEVPDEITLCINITGCKNRCKNCHSPYLAEDIGDILNKTSLNKLLENNKGVSCVSFMGGDNDTISIIALASWVKTNTNLKIAWYSGRQELDNTAANQLRWFDYIKLGPYIEELGPLNSKTTNQRFYKVHKKVTEGITEYELEDETYKFWKKSV